MRGGIHSIRRRMKSWRRRLSHPEVVERSRAMASHAHDWLADRPYGMVAAYVSIRGEMDPAPLLSLLRARGWRVCLPVTVPAIREMSMREHPEGAPLRMGQFRIPEPVGGAQVQPDKVDLALVPGLAFDKSGHRVGYGGGYYDRWLINLAGAALGLCHSEQIVDELPARPHDTPVSALASEFGVTPCTSS